VCSLKASPPEKEEEGTIQHHFVSSSTRGVGECQDKDYQLIWSEAYTAVTGDSSFLLRHSVSSLRTFLAVYSQ
jgi:hypothetical protein